MILDRLKRLFTKRTRTDIPPGHDRVSGRRLQFHTQFRYDTRETKANYVWQKYQLILKGKILDVGADECHIRNYLDEDTEYVSIGLGGKPEIQINLEEQTIPFDDNTFDCVLCLDVLEHLDNIHTVFDDLCRVSRRYVIISLPNPWASIFHAFYEADYRPGQPLKFYGLPEETPDDRHKWFFSSKESRRFIEHRSALNLMTIKQMDHEYDAYERNKSRRLGIRDEALKNVSLGPLWAVLEKENKPCG